MYTAEMGATVGRALPSREHLKKEGPSGRERLVCVRCGASIGIERGPLDRRQMNAAFRFADLHDACAEIAPGDRAESRTRPGDTGEVMATCLADRTATMHWYDGGEIDEGVPFASLRRMVRS